jgi:flagellar basal body-associated protein FliL
MSILLVLLILAGVLIGLSFVIVIFVRPKKNHKKQVQADKKFEQGSKPKLALILILLVLILLVVFLVLNEKLRPWSHPPPAPATVRYEPEEFRFNAGDTVLTVLVGPGTYHRIHSNKNFVALPRQVDGSQKPYAMPAGYSSWRGGEPEGLLRLKGLHDGTIIKSQRVR